MPDNYIASLRLAQMELAANRYDDAIASCDRGLAHASGPLGRSWLMQVKADALLQSGQRAQARRVLRDALQAVEEIALQGARQRNVEKISKMLNGIPRG
jgi:predicted Zn-dependent protease